MIGLVDANNFYVSCERAFNLALEGRPVAVLSNNDGCVISRSNEFKALGIGMGEPYFKLKPLIEQYGLILKSSNYELYGDMSRRIISALQEFSPEVEQYSIDEAFINISLIGKTDYLEYGRKIRKTLLQWLGIPCGVGFARTKTLAKLANHAGKKHSDGVFIMPDDPAAFLADIPVGEVWGVGHRLAARLETLGIRTASQLAMQDEVFLRKKFNVCLARTALELRGVPAVEDDPEATSQSVSCSRSFGTPVTELADLRESVSHYGALAAEKLRRRQLCAAGANIYFQYFPEYSPCRLSGGFTDTTVTFEVPTDDTAEMLRQISPKLEGIFFPGRRYKKTGILFFGLESHEAQQQDLFAAPAPTAEKSRLFQVIDQINRQYGKGTIFSLSEGIERKWTMKRELLSPRYTTKWGEIPKVK